MAALHGLAAVIARAKMHVEPAVDHGAGNFCLILLRDMRFAHVPAAAVRTLCRQRHLVGFVNSRRNAAMGVWPVPPTRLAPRRFRLGRRLVLLAKRRRLAFAAPPFFFQRGGKLRDLIAQRAHDRLQLRDPPLQFAASGQSIERLSASMTAEIITLRQRAQVQVGNQIRIYKLNYLLTIVTI